MQTKKQRGFSSLIVVVLLAVVIVLILIVFKTKQTEPDKNELTQNQVSDTEPTHNTDALAEFDAVIVKNASITLADVSNSGASGTAWLAVSNGHTFHRVRAQNMPALSGTDFYEGWLVKNPATGDFFSTGKMNYNSETKEASIVLTASGDKSYYRFVVITVEPDDNNPAPAAHIIEARFASETNLNVSLSAEQTSPTPETEKLVTKTFDLTGKNFAFNQNEIRVKLGDKVKINFQSTQGFHNWSIDDFKAFTKQVNLGESTSVEFVADKSGTFEFYCSVGPHRQLGMIGKLIVE